MHCNVGAESFPNGGTRGNFYLGQRGTGRYEIHSRCSGSPKKHTFFSVLNFAKRCCEPVVVRLAHSRGVVMDSRDNLKGRFAMLHLRLDFLRELRRTSLSLVELDLIACLSYRG